MKKKVSLTDREWEIMKILWRQGRGTVREVWTQLYPDNEKAYTTVQTYLERLVTKGLLRKEKIGLVNFYEPRLSEQEAIEQATRSLVSRIFGGSFGSLAAYLIDTHRLSPEDLARIKEMIENKEKEQKNG